MPLLWNLNLSTAGKELTCDRSRLLDNVCEAAARHDFSSVYSRAGSNIHDEISFTDRLLIVFNDDHGVTQVPEPGQGVQETLVISLVQADRGLIKDVHDTDKSSANLAGQADTLCLAA